MKWITRERVKVDRVACPWLIRKFIDPEAEFAFVERNSNLQDGRSQLLDLGDYRLMRRHHHIPAFASF